MEKLIQTINSLFEGDVNDKKSLHTNSLCRIVYAGYLKYQMGYKYREVAEFTNTTYGTATKRLQRHRERMRFDKDYQKKFNQLINLL
jgi:hypothetical protein